MITTICILLGAAYFLVGLIMATINALGCGGTKVGVGVAAGISAAWFVAWPLMAVAVAYRYGRDKAEEKGK